MRKYFLAIFLGSVLLILVLLTYTLFKGSTKEADANTIPLQLSQQFSKKWECINGKDPAHLTPQQQLLEFIKGPCSPVILLPGIMGTALQVQIECEVLQESNNDIFRSCGWETCSSFQFWKSSPKQEYTIWIGDVLGPASIIQFSNTNTCWGNLMGLQYNQTTRQWQSPKGVFVTWKGNSYETAKDSRCGNLAVSDITTSSLLSSCQTAVYSKFISLLDNQGYQYGITYQSVPYDFRLGVNQGYTVKIIHSALKSLYDFTGKRVIVVGHSLGTIHSYTAITRLPQNQRDKLIKLFLAIAPPFLGSIQTISDHLVGNLEFTKNIYNRIIGINYYNQKKFIHTSASSIFNLYPRDVFQRFRNEPWLQQIRERIEYERSDSEVIVSDDEMSRQQAKDKGNIPFTFLPSPVDQCFWQQNCYSGLFDQGRECFAKIANTTYNCNSESWKKFFQEQCYDAVDQEAIFEESELQELNLLQNPGVPTAVVYSTILNVSKSFEFYIDQLDKKSDANFGFANVTEFGLGDGTVLSSSAIIPALKWIWEYQNNVSAEAKPIKLVQYCSSQKQSIELFDEEDANGERVMTSGGYQGLGCQCQKSSDKDGKNINECNHSCMINDDNLVEFMNRTIFTKEKSKVLSDDGWHILSDKEIADWQFFCPAIH